MGQALLRKSLMALKLGGEAGKGVRWMGNRGWGEKAEGELSFSGESPAMLYRKHGEEYMRLAERKRSIGEKEK